jgi:phosphonopyruvate decarboxylase
MIDPVAALDVLTGAGVDFFSGVPDSLLKEFNACVMDRVGSERHVVAPNEGNAVALAAGHFLATGRPGLVYLQNSGLGNAVNPLVSLTSSEVYGLPMVLMIGWRGQPNITDEPQHKHQGRITPSLLDLLEVPFCHLTAETTDWKDAITESVRTALDRSQPSAVLVSAGTFSPYAITGSDDTAALPLRMDAIATVLDSLPQDAFFIATTGYTARELAALRQDRGEPGDRDLLVVGSMGHASSIALGMAISRPDIQVVCLDGDGALAMHLGAMSLIGLRHPGNLGHVVFNNGVHESVGGQPSALGSTDTVGVARATGYRSAGSCRGLDRLGAMARAAMKEGGPWFIEVEVRRGTMPGLPRPEDFGARAARLREVLQT